MKPLENVTVIGLTGQSGAGKTTVCETFSANGFAIINADKVAREATRKGSVCCRILEEVFPECFNDGELDRKKMGELVFNSPEQMKHYSSIVYPFITALIHEKICECAEQGETLILLDAPTLFEAKANELCSLVVSVIADEKVRLQRVLQRDNISEQAIKSRFSAQHNDKFYIDRSDYVIYNNASADDLKSTAQEVAKQIKEMYYGKKT